MKITILKLTAILLCFAGSLLFTSCTKYCKGFPEQYVDYYPYQEGYVMKFANQNNDTIFLPVSSVFKLEEETLCTGIFNKCDCNTPYFSFGTENIWANDISYDIRGGMYEDTPASIFFWFYRGGGMIVFTLENNKAEDLFSTNTLILKDDKNNQAIVVKGEGIIEFYDSENDELWKK
ncbi:MAG: hypothetical protein LBT27_06720, partial [Prevotellaceae bacterium]|nr:hypothetical protein [Prevotellaceae bacterium]